MKTQEQLNFDYDKIMIDFKQKAFIDSALHHNFNSHIEQSVNIVYEKFANHFNEHYKHIYLKPLSDLPTHNLHNDNVTQSFISIAKQLPLTFWNTTLGENITIEQSRLFISSVFALPMTEDRKKFLENQHDLYTDLQNQNNPAIIQAFACMKELSKTDKIKIQENFTEFVDSFINSSLFPESLRTRSLHILIETLENLTKKSYPTELSVDLSLERDFLKDILSSVKFNSPFQDLNHEKKWSYYTQTPISISPN